MTDDDKRASIAMEIERGRAAARSARLLLDAGELADAVSRAYYAAFHRARALLLTEGVEPKRHGTVDRLVQRDFVRTGLLDAKLASNLSTLQQQRQNADYTAEYVFTREITDELVAASESYAAAVEALLAKDGWLP
jgi:hypothetical protein